MDERVAYRAVDLGDAAERIRILHAGTVAMGFANLAAFKQLAQVAGRFQLAAMRASFVNPLVEGNIGTAEGVESESADYVSGVNERFSRQQRQNSNGQHALRAVDQRHRFFGL